MQQYISYHSLKKSVDVKQSTYIDFDKKNNQEDPIKISKYQNIFCRILCSKFV